MITQPLDFATLKALYGEQIHALAAQHKIENVRVFGSVLRGNASSESDLDILVHGLPGCRPLKFTAALNSMLAPIKVDVIDDDAVHKLLAPHILQEAKPL